MREVRSDAIKAYKAMKNKKPKYGIFRKTCFHFHTPESYDFTLLSNWSIAQYKKSSETDIYNICLTRNVFPSAVTLSHIDFEDTFSSKKEFLSFLLLAESIVSNNIEIALVADHNTVNGIEKLEIAIKQLLNFKKKTVYPEVIMGIEITCADKSHVVGLFENTARNKQAIQQWLGENLLNKKEGSFQTSIETLKFIQGNNGIGYLAHIDTSDIFKETYLSGAFRKRLFDEKTLHIVGLSELEQLPLIEARIKPFRSSKINFVLDNDAHDIDSLNHNLFWIKGSKRDFSMVREALQDYDISVSLEGEPVARQFIKGLYIENSNEGFLFGKDGEAFCLTFSNALNCLIGGRGTGKSSILDILEYVLSQRCDNERKLEFICSHGNTWVLYDFCGDEYLVEMTMPFKEHSDESILRYFDQNLYGYHHSKHHFIKEKVKGFAYKNYLKIFKVTHKGEEWNLQTVRDKREMLKKLFDTRYSVSELVKTASGEEISHFIYETLFDNRTLDRPEDVISFRSKSGLKRMLIDVDGALQKRKEDVNLVIAPFNSSQEGLLRIGYSQDNNFYAPNFTNWFFGYNQKPHGWYSKFNITKEAVIEYFSLLYDRLGIFRFLKMIIDEKIETAEHLVNILDFCSGQNTKMVEQGIESLTARDSSDFINRLFRKMITNENINDIIEYLKKYVANIEQFSLQFNINNKEGQYRKALYRPVNELSLGQKVVAMLSFILGYSDFSQDYRPLIIDQPEDNLDNQYIYKNLVSQLRSTKEKRQVIIATHNATIVTNAKADQVCVMGSDNEHGWIETTGYPGEKRIKTHIINFLEGGVESFLHKLSVYADVLDTPANKS